MKSHTAIVACVLLHGKRMALFRRSEAVAFDRGQWHCITGYLDSDVAPLVQARREVKEEAGIKSSDLTLVRVADPIVLAHGDSTWEIHPFVFRVRTNTLSLNWENTEYRWVAADLLDFAGCVWWLRDVVVGTSQSRQRRAVRAGRQSGRGGDASS